MLIKGGEINLNLLRNFYSDFRYRGEDTELFMNIGQAFTDLRGNGAVPALIPLKEKVLFILTLIILQ